MVSESILYTVVLYITVFELNCIAGENRTLMVRCEGVSGVINDSQIVCIYDDGPMREMC